MKIEFADTIEDKRLYATICMGWLKGGELQGKDQLMLGVEIQKKLALIGNWQDTSVELKAGPQTLELTNREARLLRAHCEAASYHVSWAKEAARMYEVFANGVE